MSYITKKILSAFVIILIITSCSNLEVQTLNNNALKLINEGDVDGAISRLESINDLNPTFPQTHYNLGIAYFQKKQYEKAINSLNKAISLKKDFPDAYYTLAIIYEDKANEEIEKMDKANSSDKYNSLSVIYENLTNADVNFKKYLKLTNNAEDVDKVKEKIAYLNSDLIKYNQMLKTEEIRYNGY